MGERRPARRRTDASPTRPFRNGSSVFSANRRLRLTTKTGTICRYCGVGCNLTLQVHDNRIVKVTSPLDHDVTRGHLCIKGRFGWQFVQR